MTPLFSRALIAAATSVTGLGVAPAVAQASTPSDSAPGDSVPVPSAVGAPAFPVSIETKYGTVMIEEQPERVVSVGFTDQDHLLALGVVPVGIREWYGEMPFATWPWAQDELGDAEPAVLSSTEINFEAIAALDPDLIVGVSSGMTQEEYDTLSGLAPTLTQSGDFIDYGMPWQDQLLMTSAAVGRTAEAEALVADIDAQFAAARAEHPEFVGATASVAFYYDDQPGAYASSDGRSRVLTDLGFTIPAEFDTLAGDQFFVSFSPEQLALLDTDVLVWIAGDGAAIESAQNVPGRETLRAYEQGREVFTDVELTGAFSFNSPLSLPYVLERIGPMLAAAVDGDPATPVPA